MFILSEQWYITRTGSASVGSGLRYNYLKNTSRTSTFSNESSLDSNTTCLYCKVRVVRTKVSCKMAGVTFDFHYRYHYLALTWFACKWLVVSNPGLHVVASGDG